MANNNLHSVNLFKINSSYNFTNIFMMLAKFGGFGNKDIQPQLDNLTFFIGVHISLFNTYR